MGQIDSRTDRSVFGVRLEDQGISYFAYQNGVRGLLLTGDAIPSERGGPTGQRAAMGAAHRIVGTAGVIEVAAPGSKVRLINDAAPGYQEVPLDAGPTQSSDVIAAGIADALSCLESGREPELSSHKALRATEMIFATYESARRRARIDLPLEIEDSPFLTMLEQGVIGLRPTHS
jgi:hypothetical protein